VNELLTIAQSYLDSEVAPRANVIDHDPGALRAALDGLCSRNLMALRRPEEFGGPALSEREFRQFQTMVAAVSGSLAFLQTQHQSAVSLISRSSNADLKDRYLPYMADGQKLVGIGFSQLRRKGPPLLKAQQVNGGYVLDGSVPWVTGLTFYHEFLIGATLPDGESLFGLVPFHDTENMKLGHVMKLSAMESPQTVSAAVSGLFLPDSQVVNTRPAGWIHTNDLINIILQGFFAIGCAQGGLEKPLTIRATHVSKKLTKL
jgi:alkylation response protein AidB-like acyl-CoA dehydrogenase